MTKCTYMSQITKSISPTSNSLHGDVPIVDIRVIKVIMVIEIIMVIQVIKIFKVITECQAIAGLCGHLAAWPRLAIHSTEICCCTIQ